MACGCLRPERDLWPCCAFHVDVAVRVLREALLQRAISAERISWDMPCQGCILVDISCCVEHAAQIGSLRTPTVHVRPDSVYRDLCPAGFYCAEASYSENVRGGWLESAKRSAVLDQGKCYQRSGIGLQFEIPAVQSPP